MTKTAVTGATAVDYVLPGKTVTLTLNNTLPTKVRVTINGGLATEIGTGVQTYSFTMPETDANLVVGPAKQQQTISVQSTYNIAYNTAPFNLNAQVTT